MIEWEFAPEVKEEEEEINELAASWLKLLREEIEIRERRRLKEDRERPGNREKRPDANRRSKSSLKADARTLAHLIWATQKKTLPRQRLVFVTGDRLILDTYRRWHATYGHGYSFLVNRLAVLTAT